MLEDVHDDVCSPTKNVTSWTIVSLRNWLLLVKGIFQQTNRVESNIEDKVDIYKTINNQNTTIKFGLNILNKERKALGIFRNKLTSYAF